QRSFVIYQTGCRISSGPEAGSAALRYTGESEMKIFIAGATGAIGHPLISRLVAAGYDVIGMTSSERGLQTLREAGVEAVVANALDAQAVQVAMNKARPDAVIEELTSPPKTLHARRNACCCRSRPHGETRGRTEPSERGEGGRRTAVYCAVHR